jgi:hypothetical protein
MCCTVGKWVTVSEFKLAQPSFLMYYKKTASLRPNTQANEEIKEILNSTYNFWLSALLYRRNLQPNQRPSDGKLSFSFWQGFSCQRHAKSLAATLPEQPCLYIASVNEFWAKLKKDLILIRPIKPFPWQYPSSEKLFNQWKALFSLYMTD